MRGWLMDLFQRFVSGMLPDGEASDGRLPSQRDLRYRLESKFAHEVGHAVVAWFSPAVHSVDGINFKVVGAETAFSFRMNHPDADLERAVICMAGLAGETLVWKTVKRHGFGSDFRNAQDALRAYLAKKSLADLRKRWTGLADSSLDVSTMPIPRPTAEIGEGMNICYRRAKRVISDHRAGFDRLLSLVQRKGSLTADDIASQFGPRIWSRL